MRSSCPGLPVLLISIFASQTLAFPSPNGAASSLSILFRSDYEDEVCDPMTLRGSDTVPPCLEIRAIETICTPNGTSPLALKAHQECMCEGSFFDEWPFCLQCLYLHGLRTQREVAFYESVLSAASTTLCHVPTPADVFASVFSSAKAAAPSPTTGDTVSSDQAVGQTAVSLYFTAPSGHSQGPGRITGEAAAATATRLFTAPPHTPTTAAASQQSCAAATTARPSATGAASSAIAGSSVATSRGPRARAGRKGLLFAAVAAVACAAL
ncbi:hypothetical protein B0T26DRAFT_748739 [Lasiosphaeria miniovina]|uniref:Uncharacterized protein n=1 Tax=Lasiosphaeria miniovina TaxID=1954250 RepID=A0AA40E826_9PEZI|nr:uncharacterized protein B0T26DRAFT_748739 [Lasiosphaeria miniovina]KAK0728542.1 hypothetical protein B0T26DRAFT_748739 [Lasiosphaeria miniovina]